MQGRALSEPLGVLRQVTRGERERERKRNEEEQDQDAKTRVLYKLT